MTLAATIESWELYALILGFAPGRWVSFLGYPVHRHVWVGASTLYLPFAEAGVCLLSLVGSKGNLSPLEICLLFPGGLEQMEV